MKLLLFLLLSLPVTAQQLIRAHQLKVWEQTELQEVKDKISTEPDKQSAIRRYENLKTAFANFYGMPKVKVGCLQFDFKYEDSFILYYEENMCRDKK